MSKKPKQTASKTPAAGKVKRKKACIQTGCRAAPETNGYCRLHYIENWKRIRLNRQVKAERRLNSYISRLAKKYPKDYLEKIKEGLEDPEKFSESLQEIDLHIHETGENFTDEEFLEKLVRGLKISNE